MKTRYLLLCVIQWLIGATTLRCFQCQLMAVPQSQPRQIIDGATNPDLIPDWRAYSVFFQFVATNADRDLPAIQGYLKQIGLNNDGPSMQIDTVIRLARTFSMQLRDLDRSVGPTTNADARRTAEVTELRQKLIGDNVSSLNGTLGQVDASKVLLHIQRMKATMRLVK